ncbi:MULTISPECIES: lipopolysaccharide transport periplasmic protein LptA [Asticcacaulis]|uniref:lipopolysaccharide transport periplasmic protein LptA n=1 Tax=Asticcacaulis TaxID=76890 RepID=UPI001AE3B7F3|nr:MULTISPECIES: lipopolysaccharide transport periplasmic protein LptA [Asticcacaulis]MBP2159971.1 lipopolysaccharide export system protein LptA [Asticcacaulis solisilvae]MDR6801016.1 lipopolysaccharide export system protein LptA [Asticcacaulis sp. BE141]
MNIRIGAALTVLALTAGGATAQVSGQGGPVQIGADSQRIEQQANAMYLDGRVEILQDKARLRTDHATITYAEPGGDINRIEATGNIFYVTVDAQGQQTIMKGDNAVYTKADDTMVVTGNVILQQGQNVSTGNRLVSQVSKGITTFTANPGGQTKGRVRSVLYPNNNRPAQ